MKTIIGSILSVFMFSIQTQEEDATKNTVLTKVKSKNVCMVNDTHFGKPQIPVQVSGKTYFGCCENCKKTLRDSKGSRVAVDPVTKKSVDKATAIIGADKSGRVFYFADQNNFSKFNQSKNN